MPFQVSPGVQVTERDLTTVVPNVATTIGAIAGQFQWGPVLERITITTENDLVRVFGEPDDVTAEYFWSAANYLSYSNNLLVVRNTNNDASNAVIGDHAAEDTGAAGTARVVQNGDNYDSLESTIATEDNLFIAKYPGALGNSLEVYMLDSAGWDAGNTMTDAPTIAIRNKFRAIFNSAPGTSTDVAASGGSNDEIHVLVIDKNGLFTGTAGEILEAHGFLSKARDAKKYDGSSNYVRTVLRNQSRYIWLGSPLEITAISDDAGSAINAGQLKGINSTFKRINGTTDSEKILGGHLAGGNSGSVITAGQEETAYLLYLDPEAVDVSLLIAGPASAVTGKKIIDNIAAVRKDCVAFVSPQRDTVVNALPSTRVQNITTEKTSFGSSNYGVMDNAWKYQYDRYRDLFLYVPMNADIAGLCARTDLSHDSWYSPAGLTRGTIKNIVKTSWEPNKAERDILYQSSVNPITTQQGAGVLLFGDKTMQTTPTAFDRINVRRLFIVLEKAIANAAKAMLFEFNDEFTRAQFVNIVTPFLREIQGRRGVTDFKVVCDSSNNTGQVIDTNNFVGDIYVKPTRSINFIQLNFIASRSDVSFSEIGG